MENQTTTKPVRIGMIGCGGRARAHMSALTKRDGVQIAGVSDPFEPAAKQAGERLGVPAFTDHRRLLELELDTLWLSLPVFAHGEVERDVIGRGLNFFVEKPVARHLETAQEISAKLKAAGIWAGVGYQLRYSQAVRSAKAYLDGQTVALVDGHYWCGTGRAGSWVSDWEKSGGQLVEQATHTFDLARYLVGDVAEVYAQQANRVLHDIKAPDTYVVQFRFANGALGSITTSWVHDPSDWAHANILNFGLDGRLLRYDGSGLAVLPASHEQPAAVEGPDIYDAFLAAVRANDPSLLLADYDEGLKTLALTLAADESGRTRRPVTLEAL